MVNEYKEKIVNKVMDNAFINLNFKNSEEVTKIITNQNIYSDSLLSNFSQIDDYTEYQIINFTPITDITIHAANEICDLFLVKFEMGKKYQIIKHGEISKIFTINNCELFLLNTDFLNKKHVIYDTFDNISCPLYINIDIEELNEYHKGIFYEYNNIYQLFNINGKISDGYDILGESYFNLEFYEEFMNTSSLDDYEDMISKCIYPKKINIKFRYDYYIHSRKFEKDKIYQFYMVDNMILHLPNSNINIIGRYNNIKNASYN